MGKIKTIDIIALGKQLEEKRKILLNGVYGKIPFKQYETLQEFIRTVGHPKEFSLNDTNGIITLAVDRDMAYGDAKANEHRFVFELRIDGMIREVETTYKDKWATERYPRLKYQQWHTL